MGSRKLRTHRYIDDGIVYTNHVFDGNGNNVRMSELWEKWNYKHPNANPRIEYVLSYDRSGGYVSNKILDIRVCGDKDMMMVTTRMGRKLHFSIDSCIITDKGPLRVRNLGVGTKVLAVDNYKNYYGDKVRLLSHGNARVRALLRNHGVPFEQIDYDGTRTEHYDFYCWDFETDGPVFNGNTVTFGMNNYREGIKELLGLPDYTYDEVVSIRDGYKRKYSIALYLENPQNVVLQNGLVVQSTQTKVRDDW